MNRKVSKYLGRDIPQLLCNNLKPVEEVYKNSWFSVFERGSYFTLEYERPQVVVLPIADDSKVIMVRVKRPVINDTPLELPAGDSNSSELPINAAQREFAEETGIYIKDIQRFKPILPISEMPGRIPVLLSVFKVHVLMEEYLNRAKHDSEIESVVLLSFYEAVQKIISGDIYLSSPMAIVARYLLSKVKIKE